MFEYVPTVVSGLLERANDARDVEVAVTQRPVQPVPHRVPVSEIACGDPPGHGRRHVLQVDMDHAVGGFPSERQRVTRPHDDVTGIEAQADVGDLEQPFHVPRSLYHGPVMRVHGHTQSAFAGQATTRSIPRPSAAQPTASSRSAPS